MAYRTVVMDYEPRAPRMAERIDAKLAEMEGQGWRLVALTETPSARAILVFHDGGAAPAGDSAES